MYPDHRKKLSHPQQQRPERERKRATQVGRRALQQKREEEDARAKEPVEEVEEVGDPDLTFQLVEEYIEVSPRAYIQHKQTGPHLFSAQVQIGCSYFIASTAGIHFNAEVRAAHPPGKDPNITGWSVGYIQNIVESREEVRYKDGRIQVGYPKVPVLDSATTSGFPWCHAAAKRDHPSNFETWAYEVTFYDQPKVRLPYLSLNRLKKLEKEDYSTPDEFVGYEVEEVFCTWLIARYDLGGEARLHYLRRYVWRMRLEARRDPEGGFTDGVPDLVVTEGPGLTLLWKDDGMGDLEPVTTGPLAIATDLIIPVDG